MSSIERLLHRASQRAEALASQSLRPARRPGPDVIPMHIGDPSFATPPFILEAMTEALRAGYTRYAQPAGDSELREALASELSARLVHTVTAAQITITAGGSPAINSAILATVTQGDRVIIPEPTYSLYRDTVLLAGGTAVTVPSTPALRLDVPRIAEAAYGARMIILCNPGNPTGIVHSREELTAIGEIADENNLLVLSDEAYDHIVFDGIRFTSALDIPSLVTRTLYCQTFSKRFAMTGWRLGYVAAPPELSSAVALMHRTYNGPVNTAVQRAGLAAIASASTWPDERRVDYQRARDLTVRALTELPDVELAKPEGAFYAFPRISRGRTSQEIVDLALSEGVGLRLGTEFGTSGEGAVRLAFCLPDDVLSEGLNRLRDLILRL